MSSEIEIETIPGLPGDLPPGEKVVWQGRPQWRALARQTFKVRWVAGYFVSLIVIRAFFVLRDHEGFDGVTQLLFAMLIAAGCLGLLHLLAWLNARSTIYTITTKRVVFRIGVALPMTWNLPFKRLATADLAARSENEGDIVLQLTAPNRIGWLHLWPHVQPGHIVKARPTIRAIAAPARVASLLANAVQTWAQAESAPVLVSTDTFETPRSSTRPLATHWPVTAEKSA
jgi:Bacterial PH domain